MTKQDKIKKVMDEFKRGTLKTPDGKVVKNRKQALAIAMSESEDYTEKGELIHQLSIGSVNEAIDILKSVGTDEEELLEKAKHQDGDMHPNGKWVWVASAAGGRGDWRTAGGRAHKKRQAGAAAGSDSTGTSSVTGNTVQPKPKAATQPKLTASQQRIVDGFMDKVKTSDSRYSDPSKVTLWKTPKGNWYVKYDGHQVATIAPLGLTEKIAESAGMKIDREPSSYQSSKAKKSTVPKTDKERLDLQQEYATMSQLIKKPSTSAQHKKEFQERMKEIEGMGLKVVKGKFQWSDTGSAVTPKTASTPKKSSAPKIDTETVDQAIYDKHYNDAMSLKDSSDVSAEVSIQFGLSTHKGFLRDTKKKLEETLQNRPGAKATIAKLQKDLTRFVSTTKALEQALVDRKKKQKKLRPVGTGTNGLERRRKEGQRMSKVPKGKRISTDDDLVEVYDNNGKKIYSGIFDDCPYKNYGIKWNQKDGNYDLPSGYKMVGK